MINNVTSKKVFLETYGCQMNEYDSELVRSILKKENYAFVPEEQEADIIMLNTCAIREHAHRKVYGRVQRIHHDRAGKLVMIGILGCMATNLRTELFEDKGLKIDFIAGPDSYKRLPNLIKEAQATGDKQFDLTLSEYETYSDVYPARKEGINAWIAVMRGCNNFCTFCVVPYTRGRERSRSVGNVVSEVEKLAADGFKQVTLLGQNVNSYQHEGSDFADLMKEVAQVDGIERIRFTSPHPKDFPDKFLEVMASEKKVCNHIHLPLQAGNNRILDLMNRTYTREEFLALVQEIRSLIPNVALSTDIIVGFSSETDAEFEETVEVMEEVQFDSAFMFKYSERQQTVAQRKLPDNVSEEKKTERIVRLNDLQKHISYEKNKAHIGTIEEVMIESTQSERADDAAYARTDGNKGVTLPKGNFKAGDLIPCKIVGASPFALKGEAIS